MLCPHSLIKSGCRSGKWQILLELVQQFAGLADGQVFGRIAVKAIVDQLLPVQPTASGQTVNCIGLVGCDAAAKLLFRATLRLLSWLAEWP